MLLSVRHASAMGIRSHICLRMCVHQLILVSLIMQAYKLLSNAFTRQVYERCFQVNMPEANALQWTKEAAVIDQLPEGADKAQRLSAFNQQFEILSSTSSLSGHYTTDDYAMWEEQVYEEMLRKAMDESLADLVHTENSPELFSVYMLNRADADESDEPVILQLLAAPFPDGDIDWSRYGWNSLDEFHTELEEYEIYGNDSADEVVVAYRMSQSDAEELVQQFETVSLQAEARADQPTSSAPATPQSTKPAPQEDSNQGAPTAGAKSAPQSNPAGKPADAQWACDKCTFLNAPKATRCEMCNEPNANLGPGYSPTTPWGVITGGGRNGLHRAHFRGKNRTTGQLCGFATETNDNRAISLDPAQRKIWIGNVSDEYAFENGWNASDTEIWLVGEDELKDNMCKVKIGFQNTATGERGSGMVAASRSPEDQGEENFIKDMRRKHSVEAGWRYEDTQIWVIRVQRPAGQPSSPSSAPPPSTSTPPSTSSAASSAPAYWTGESPKTPWGVVAHGGENGYHIARFRGRNRLTGERIGFQIQTNDDDAISNDPALRELFIDGVREEHAYETGCNVADVDIWLEGGDPAHRRSAAAPSSAPPPSTSAAASSAPSYWTGDSPRTPWGVNAHAGEEGRHVARFRGRNRSTGESIHFQIQTGDDDAISNDPVVRELFIARVRERHTLESGADIADVDIWLEGGDPAHRRSAAATTDPWICAKCTFQNQPGAILCQMCQTPQPKVTIKAEEPELEPEPQPQPQPKPEVDPELTHVSVSCSCTAMHQV